MHRVFVGFPHGGMLCPGALVAASQASKSDVMARAALNSILCHNFNTLWCDALNYRAQYGITHFAMCHYDIRPEPFWVDRLFELMEVHDADIVSAVVAIKDERGLSSTGVGNFDTRRVRRLTMREVYDLPATFSVRDTGPDYLAVNTGLWLARIDTGWADGFPGFETHTAVRRDAEGMYQPVARSEDWLMSRWAATSGLRVFATSAVRTFHGGFKEYSNDSPWGEWITDHNHLEEV